MADMNGENAFLASMDEDDYTPQYAQSGSDGEEEEDYDPSSFFGNGENTNPAQGHITEDSAHQHHIIPTTLQASHTASEATSQAPSRTGSRMANSYGGPPKTSQPVVIGGFVEDDDSDDDDDDEDEMEQARAPQMLGTQEAVAVASAKSPSQAHPGSVSQTPVPASAHVYDPSQVNTGVSALSTNGTVDPASSLSIPDPSHDATTSSEGKTVGDLPAPSQSNGTSLTTSNLPKARLPHDVVGQYEDRIKDDPKGDADAWMGLIAHLKSRKKYDETRQVYERFLKVFPTASDVWVSYAQMELELDDLPRLEVIFQSALMKVQSIQLWSIYLDHVRRRNDIITDASGQGRQVVSQAYNFVLDQVGNDKDAGQLWIDYIGFVKSGPGTAGGTGWQDAQKMDLLRKAYQRAVCAPTSVVATLWREYDAFENGLNKMTGRKFLQEKSPAYMTARTSYTALQNITQGLKRGGVPRLPPFTGFEGDEDYQAQTAMWQKWIAWEKDDPLVLKDEDLNAYKQRILYVYKQAVMALRFQPTIWYDAAEYCFANAHNDEGNEFLAQGIEANPESCLLAFRRADRIEQTTTGDESEDGAKRRGDAVRQPYDVTLTALYALIEKVKERESRTIARIEEDHAAMEPDSREGSPEAKDEEDDDDENAASRPLSRKAQQAMAIDAIQAANRLQTTMISKTLTFVWIALMRAMRRIQGKGKPGDKLGGMRQVFADARKKGRVTSDLYAVSALLEHFCYKDPAAQKIFERGIRLFPEDEGFALEYMKFMISINDATNVRAVFEMAVSKITAKPETVQRAKLLYHFFHEYESKYGELAQIAQLEKRMAELFPEDPALTRFAARFSNFTAVPPVFDPCTVRLHLSPSQTRPKMGAVPTNIPTIETPQHVQSPKRAFDDSDAEQPVRKFARGESPLKGAAGRRQQQQRQARETHGSQLAPANLPPKPLPAQISTLLSSIPPAKSYVAVRFDPQAMVNLLRSVDPSRAMFRGQPVAPSSNYSYGF